MQTICVGMGVKHPTYEIWTGKTPAEQATLLAGFFRRGPASSAPSIPDPDLDDEDYYLEDFELDEEIYLLWEDRLDEIDELFADFLRRSLCAPSRYTLMDREEV